MHKLSDGALLGLMRCNGKHYLMGKKQVVGVLVALYGKLLRRLRSGVKRKPPGNAFSFYAMLLKVFLVIFGK
jgi:hypothetical protein